MVWFHPLQNILKTLTPLKFEEMYKFRSWLKLTARDLKDTDFMEGDLLNFVDKMIEVLGKIKKGWTNWGSLHRD